MADPCTPAFLDTPVTYTDINQAIIDAADGDVICLAATGGTPYAWPTQIDPGTKAVEIRGHGNFPSTCADALDITGGCGSAAETEIIVSSAAAVFGSNDSSSTGHFTISNIRFRTTAAGSPATVLSWNAVAANKKPWIVHHNDFIVEELTGTQVYHAFANGATSGIIYRNRFICEPGAAWVSGFTNTTILRHIRADNGKAAWETASTFGSADTDDDDPQNIYFETNYIEGFLASDIAGSARSVIRFNELHLGGFTTHGFDSDAAGARGMEYLFNKFYCDIPLAGASSVALSNWTSVTGGTGFAIGNTYPAPNVTICNNGGSAPSPFFTTWRKAFAATVAGWPGTYEDTYPGGHTFGWGWASTGTTTVGSSTKQNDPGGAGFDQILEPFYMAHNTNSSGHTLNPSPGTISPGAYPAMAYSNFSKSADTKIVVPNASAALTPYVSLGQTVLVISADLVGGTTPTLGDDCNGGQTWTPREGGTNGSMRLMAWSAVFDASCNTVFTVTHDSSSAARAMTVIVTRAPVDRNPPVATDNTSSYTGPLSTTLSQTNELVIGYFALNGPTIYDNAGNPGSFLTDAITAGTDTTFAISCQSCLNGLNFGVNGTSGSTADTNVTIATVYRRVTADTSVQLTLNNGTFSRNGIAGTITFASNSNDNETLDLQVTDLIANNREYYFDNGSFNGTNGGTGAGDRGSRPSSCTPGVAWWSTNDGSWNISGAGEQGVLDKCTATDTWTNDFYHPKTYPHPLATEIGGDETPPVEPPSTHHRALLTF